MKKFMPRQGHLKILPKEITDVAKKVGDKMIYMPDRSKDEKIKAVNQGTIKETSSLDPLYHKGAEVVYYPFSANKFAENETEYHIIHEKDIMGVLVEE